MKKKKILIPCEFSGIVRDAFLEKGHDAISCDLLPTERPGPHYRGDIRDILDEPWDMIIAFPPCTYLANIGNRWLNEERYGEKARERKILRKEAIKFFMLFANHPCKKICIENPVGIMPKIWREWDQIVCPTSFGHRIPKRTCLWLKGLPPLMATKKSNPIYRKSKSGKLETPIIYDTLSLKVEERAKVRSRFWPGIAAAMAEQWE